AALVQRHQPVFFREEACHGGCLLRHPGGGIAGAAFRNFVNLEAAEAELAADIIEALAIALGKLPFGTLLQPADSDDDQAHPVFSCAPEGAQHKVHALSPIRTGWT